MKRLIFFFLILFFLCGCDKDPIPTTAPTITTGVASNVMITTATVSLSMTDNSITKEIGVLYSTSSISLSTTDAQKVSISNFKSGENSASLKELSAGTIYYYKAYATDGYASIYGEIKTFTTGIDYPILTTNIVSSITSTTATCGGNISNDGGGTVTARGVCWSTISNPTISDNKTIDGIGEGNFISSLTGLTANTTYYLRAYATNEKGIAYGTLVAFTTLSIKAVYSQTINGYTLIQDEIWSGNFLLKGDIVVPSGITLTISPGTVINIYNGTPLYDGIKTGKIEFDINGSLIINGTAQNIVQLKSAANSPTNNDWGGIDMSGNRFEIAYCYISDSQFGVFSSSTSAMKIKNCLFNNISNTAIVDFGSLQHTLSYNSFINVISGYDLFQTNKNSKLDYSEFKNNYYDVKISGITGDVTNNSSISVNYSNFSGNKTYNLLWSGGGVTNSSIKADYCYGITTYLTNGNGNTYTYTNKLTTPYTGAGCGFSSMAKSPSVQSSILSSNPEQLKRTIQEYNKEIIQKFEKMKSQ